MGLEEKLPSGILLTTVEKVAGYARKSSVWLSHLRPGLLRDRADVHRRAPARPGPVRHGTGLGHAAAGRPDDRGRAGQPEDGAGAAADLRPDGRPQVGHLDGVCASSGGMFNNYAIVQGVDHIVPVDIYLPGCPPRPEMLLDSIVKLHDKIQNMKLGRQPGGRDRGAGAGPAAAAAAGGPSAATTSRRTSPRSSGPPEPAPPRRGRSWLSSARRSTHRRPSTRPR